MAAIEVGNLESSDDNVGTDGAKGDPNHSPAIRDFFEEEERHGGTPDGGGRSKDSAFKAGGQGDAVVVQSVSRAEEQQAVGHHLEGIGATGPLGRHEATVGRDG